MPMSWDNFYGLALDEKIINNLIKIDQIILNTLIEMELGFLITFTNDK